MVFTCLGLLNLRVRVEGFLLIWGLSNLNVSGYVVVQPVQKL